MNRERLFEIIKNDTINEVVGSGKSLDRARLIARKRCETAVVMINSVKAGISSAYMASESSRLEAIIERKQSDFSYWDNGTPHNSAGKKDYAKYRKERFESESGIAKIKESLAALQELLFVFNKYGHLVQGSQD